MTNTRVNGDKVLCQLWIESERGWGTRPDGYSLHLGYASLVRFIDGYWADMPDVAPAEYSRPLGDPYWVTVADEVFAELEAKGGSLRSYSNGEIPQ